MQTSKFSIEEALRTGWEKTKQNFLFLFATGLSVVVINAILNAAAKDKGIESVLAGIVLIVFSVFVNVGIIKILLGILSDHKPQLHTFFEITPRQFINYIVAGIVYALCVLVGLILLIVPGVIAILRLQFVYYFIVEKNLGPIQSLKASWEATRGETAHLLLYALSLILLNLLGIVLMFLGLIVTIPMTLISMAYVYRKLTSTMIPQVEVKEAHPVIVSPPAEPKQEVK